MNCCHVLLRGVLASLVLLNIRSVRKPGPRPNEDHVIVLYSRKVRFLTRFKNTRASPFPSFLPDFNDDLLCHQCFDKAKRVQLPILVFDRPIDMAMVLIESHWGRPQVGKILQSPNQSIQKTMRSQTLLHAAIPSDVVKPQTTGSILRARRISFPVRTYQRSQRANWKAGPLLYSR